MTLYIIGAIACLFSVASLLLERSKVRKALKIWCEIGALMATLLIFFVATYQQHQDNLEKTNQAAALEKMQIKSDHILESERLQSENEVLQLANQKVQIAKATEHADAQKTQLELEKALNEKSARLIEAQRGEIQLLNRLTLNHNLLGIELSFIPSRERWNAIAMAYKGTVPPEQGVSYIDAPMMAEREGDHWRITFGEIKSREGNKMLGDLSTADPNNKAFEKVIDAASLGLRIEWGNATTTAFEPWRQRYPSAIYVSRDSIALILRPPLLLWNLNDLNDNRDPIVMFYGRDYPVALPTGFRIRSLDPAVVLDQTIPLDWKNRGKSRDPEQQMNRQVSGPHRLSIAFSRLDIFRLTGSSPSKRNGRHK